MSSAGSRGKWAEGKFTKACKELDEQAFATFYRFPDARAGFRQPAPCDYMLMVAGRMCVVECKEVEHSHNLPYGNYAADQHARIMKWVWAGAKGYIIVACKQAVENYMAKDARIWRLMPVEAMADRPTEPRPGTKRRIGSWDLSSYPLMTLAEAMKIITYTP